MYRILFGLVISSGLIANSLVLAADWKSYGGSSYSHYDASSLVKKGNKIHVWVKSVEEGGLNGVPASIPKRTNVELFIIDCKARTSNLQAASSKYQDGITRDSIHQFPNAGRAEPIVPDSDLDSLSKLICKSKWWPF